MRGRFQELWEVEPWGLIRGALGVLERIWVGRMGSGVVNVSREGEGGTLLEGGKKGEGDGDWIGELRGQGVDWLIL